MKVRRITKEEGKRKRACSIRGKECGSGTHLPLLNPRRCHQLRKSAEPVFYRQQFPLLEQDTSGVLVIIEDTKHGIQKALSRDDGFAAKFSEKINIPIFTSDELVSFAKSYANELGYTIDEMGVLALYNSISNIEHADRETTLTEVKEIVDKAVAHSEKGGLKKAFSIITSRRYDEDDYIILREKDFD